MSTLTHYWNEFWDIFRHGIGRISNPVVGLFIALIGGLMARGLINIFIIAFVAVCLHVLADALIPAIMNHAPFILPKLDHAFFEYALTLYVAYFVVILAIVVVKMIFASVRG